MGCAHQTKHRLFGMFKSVAVATFSLLPLPTRPQCNTYRTSPVLVFFGRSQGAVEETVW